VRQSAMATGVLGSGGDAASRDARSPFHEIEALRLELQAVTEQLVDSEGCRALLIHER